jgi:hypothetical protein
MAAPFNTPGRRGPGSGMYPMSQGAPNRGARRVGSRPLTPGQRRKLSGGQPRRAQTPSQAGGQIPPWFRAAAEVIANNSGGPPPGMGGGAPPGMPGGAPMPQPQMHAPQLPQRPKPQDPGQPPIPWMADPMAALGGFAGGGSSYATAPSPADLARQLLAEYLRNR